jgi:Ser/Thr protein kinase RdoA (MazF antagonist)
VAPPSSAELTAALERALAASRGESVRLEQLERRPCPYRTSFALEELDVVLTGGERLRLMFKDIGESGLDPRARAAKPAFLYDPLREIEAYRDLLAPAGGLGTPAFHGADVDAAAGRHWLFIENVAGAVLWQVGEIEVWQRAARWLARMHSDPVAGMARERAQHLLRYDERLWRLWPARALSFEHPREERESIAAIARGYDAVVDRLASLPTTFVHGEFYASNVLVPDDERIAPVDWELAAIGPGLLDVAALTTGNWTDDKRDAIVAAYIEALPADAPAPPADEIPVALDCCRLHLALQWLGWAEGWVPPEDHRQDWLAEARRLAARLEL